MNGAREHFFHASFCGRTFGWVGGSPSSDYHSEAQAPEVPTLLCPYWEKQQEVCWAQFVTQPPEFEKGITK